MRENIYYDKLNLIFLKTIGINNDIVWEEIYRTLNKLEPNRENKELFSQIVECFEQFEAESTNAKMSLFFLSFLINLTDDIKYFEKFIYLCINSPSIPANSKFYAFNYCCALMKDRFYFKEEHCIDVVNSLFDICFNVNKKYLSAELRGLAGSSIGNSVLLVVSSLGEYPFGSIKHILDVCDFFTRAKERIRIFITHEQSFEYGRFNLYPISTYKLDMGENTTVGVCEILKLNNNIEVYEFNSKNSYISESKQALLKLCNDRPSLIINLTNKSIFSELLKLELDVTDIKDISIEETSETQDNVLKLTEAAIDHINEHSYAEAEKCLFHAYEISKNNKVKAGICKRLADLYLKLKNKENALECARGLLLLEDGVEAYDCLAQVYEEMNDNKNAMFIYEKILQTDKHNYLYNLKLFSLYVTEKLYEKATVKNDYFKNKSDTYIENLRHQFYFASYMEKEAFEAMDTMLKLLKEAGSVAKYAKMLIRTLAIALYYRVYDDDEYVKILEEMYNSITPVKENNFIGYEPKKNLIRIAFLSGEIARHPVGYFISSLFKVKAKSSRFEYYFYYASRRNEEDNTTETIKETADAFKYVGDLTDNEISEVILSDKVDMLIDLNGVSSSQRIGILVNRLAPVQFTWIGFPGSLPIKNMDYNIVDNYTDPVGIAEKYYTEKLAYLPKTFLCYGIETDVEIKEPPLVKNGYVTFGSYSNAYKYSESILKIWSRLLDEIKDARLIIRTSGAEKKFTKEKLVEKFIKNGIDMKRTEILPTTYSEAYYMAYNDVDIILDTYPFNGATTTCDAFLMGTPIISLYGARHAERVGLSMLSNVGLADLAVSSAEDYVKKAVELSSNPDRLRFLKRNLRNIAMASPLMDYEEFKRDFEEMIYKVYLKETFK